MADAQKALDVARMIDDQTTAIVSDVRLAVTVRCGGKPQFMAIMLGAVLRKVAALLDETERKARTDAG